MRLGWAGQALVLVYVFVGAVVVLLVVTRLAARRDAARKAELAERARASTDADARDRLD